MSQYVDSMEWGEPVLPESHHATLETEAKRATGRLPAFFKYVTPCEWLARSYIVGSKSATSYARAEDMQLAMAAAAQENACRYCYGMHRTVLRLLGFDEAQIVRMEGDLQLAELAEPGRTLVSFARQLAKSNPRPARKEFEALLAVGLSRGAGLELAFGVASACFANRLTTFLAVPPESKLESMPDSWMGRLMRPLIARKIRGKPQPAPPLLGSFDFPFGSVVATMDGTHAAAQVRDMVLLAFGSSGLSRRSRALVFAIVAHTIGCARTAGESRRMLQEEGLDEATAEEVLAHLASPKLDRLESTIVSYARDSVHYRPLEIQRRTRALADELGPVVALEAVGTTALANMIVRMAMLAEC